MKAAAALAALIGFGLRAAADTNPPVNSLPHNDVMGPLIYGALPGTCGAANAATVLRAVRDVRLLTDATLGMTAAHLVFREFFGTGWNATIPAAATTNTTTAATMTTNVTTGGGSGSGGSRNYSRVPADILQNFSSARVVTDNFTVPAYKYVHLTCADVSRLCRDGVAAYTTRGGPGTFRRQTMVFCPHYFTSPALFHVAERVKGRPTTNLRGLVSRESVLLHELLHVDDVGYETAYANTHVAPEKLNPQPNHSELLDDFSPLSSLSLHVAHSSRATPSFFYPSSLATLLPLTSMP